MNHMVMKELGAFLQLLGVRLLGRDESSGYLQGILKIMIKLVCICLFRGSLHSIKLLLKLEYKIYASICQNFRLLT